MALSDEEKYDLLLKSRDMEGAGAFVCGEETALMASIEGRRGMPAPKPPFPSQKGLWRKPTVINNVETLAQVARIITEGPEAYRSVGTKTSPGTKTFALTGHVVNTGLIEVPFGTTLREVVFNIGGGVTDDRGFIDKAGFKAVQIGGPSGGCLTPDQLDLPLDFDSLRSVGAMGPSSRTRPSKSGAGKRPSHNSSPVTTARVSPAAGPTAGTRTG